MVAQPVGKAQSTPVELYVEPSSVENVALVPKTTFNVSVELDNIPTSPGLAGLQFNLTWDPTVLKGVSMQEIMFHQVTPESDWSNIWQLSNTVTNGSASYAYTFMSLSEATSDGSCPISGNYTVANITLEVVGTGQCALHFVMSKLADPTASPISHDTVDGFFSNLPPPPAPKPALLYVSPGSISNASLTQSSNFTMDINIINASGMSGLEFNLGFNVSVLHANSVVNGSFLPSLITPITQINNTVGFVSFNVSLTTPLSGNGTVAVIQLQVEANDVSNSTLHLYDVALVNSTDQPLPFTTIDGSFTNLYYIPGDLNHDGIVDIADAIILAKAFGAHGPNYDYPGEPASPNWNPEADLDTSPPSNDTIDIFDAIVLLSHFGQTAAWYVPPT
jgi:hypothetical protein